MNLNKNYYSIFIIISFVSCFLLGCLNHNSSLYENKSGIYFFITQNNDQYVGFVGVPKDNKSLTVCVDKDKCEFEEGKIIGATFAKDLENAKLYKIDDSIKLSSKIEAIRDNDNRRKIEIGESGFSDVDIGDLNIIQLTKRTNSNNSAYGDVLNDIISYYLPTAADCLSYTTYLSTALPTSAHETTHGLNACIRNHKNNTGKKANGFYLLEGKAVVVEEPNMKKSVVANYVPSNLRNLNGNKFDMYVTGQQSFEDRPLYIFDEWVAYINGGKEAIGLYNQSKLKPDANGYRDINLVGGAVEFMVYSSALVKALSEKDPSYLQSNTQFKALFKYLAKTTVSLYNQGKGKSELIASDAESYVNRFKSSDLYSFITKNFGDLGL